MVNFDELSIQLGVNDDLEPSEVLRRFETLKQRYSSGNLVEIYNYFLTVIKNPDILMYLIRENDKYREKSSMNVLLDLLLFKETFKDNLSDEKEIYVNTRAMCAKAIANFKDTSAVVPLLYCLNDKDENYKVRLACAEALGRIGDKYAVAPLIELIKDEDEKSVYLQESAVLALGMLGDYRAVDPLVSILETKKGILDKFTFLKERTLEALSKLNFRSDRVFKALKNSLIDESPYVRINAIEALMESEDERAYDLIKEMILDEDDEVKKNALIASYNLVGKDILDEVLSDNEDKYSDFVKEEAQNLINEYETENNETK